MPKIKKNISALKEKKFLNSLENVYTRLMKTNHGIGIIAIRKIPKGIDPFVGSKINLIKIKKSIVDEIKNEEIKKLVIDFSALQDDYYYTAKEGPNSINIGFYLNHSDRPNLIATNYGESFKTKREIKIGEELLADYKTYDHSDLSFTTEKTKVS